MYEKILLKTDLNLRGDYSGEKLPTHRWLADKIGVTAGTVSRAYQEAERLGLVQARVGSGTYVYQNSGTVSGLSALQTPCATENVIDLCANFALPPEHQGLQQALAQVSERLPQLNLLGYQPAHGVPHQLEWAQAWLQKKNLPVAMPRLSITMGGQHGVMLALMVSAKAGDTIACEGLTYPGLAAIAMQLGMKVHGLAMDDEGVLPEAFESACIQNNVRVLYLTPAVQNPTNASMGLARRLGLIELAQRYQVMIIEDTVSESHIDDLSDSFATLAPLQSLCVVSHSKHLAGGLRVGYLVAPETYADRLSQAIKAQCWSSSSLVVEATQRWIDTDAYTDMVQCNRQVLAHRKQQVEQKLASFGVVTQTASSHVWLPLEDPWRAQDLHDALLAQGVRVLTAQAFAVGRFPVPQAIRFCLGSVRSQADFDTAINEIAQQLALSASPRLDVF